MMLAPAGQGAFQLLLVPRFVGNLVLKVYPEADVAKGFRLVDPLVVVSDHLLFRS